MASLAIIRPPERRHVWRRLGQAEAGDHLAQFLPRRDMGDADLAELVEIEQGEPLGEELAIDDALAEARNDPEADAAGEFVERVADAAHIARLDILHAVPEHDPVDARARVLARWVRLFQTSSA